MNSSDEERLLQSELEISDTESQHSEYEMVENLASSIEIISPPPSGRNSRATSSKVVIVCESIYSADTVLGGESDVRGEQDALTSATEDASQAGLVENEDTPQEPGKINV